VSGNTAANFSDSEKLAMAAQEAELAKQLARRLMLALIPNTAPIAGDAKTPETKL
jgi:hypothetical protein